MFHRQVFEELRRANPHSTDPAEAIAIGAVEASFKILASSFIVLTGSGRYAVRRYRGDGDGDAHSSWPSLVCPPEKWAQSWR